MKPNLTVVKRYRPLFSGERPTFSTVLVGCLIDLYGIRVLNWDGLTIQLQLKDDLDVDPPRTVYDQFMALISALNSDLVYREVAVFDEFVSAVNGNGFGTDREPPEATDLVWAVAELQMNDPEPAGHDHTDPFDLNVKRYMRAVLSDEGVLIPPRTVGFLDQVQIRKENRDDPTAYADAYQSAQMRADELDLLVKQRTERLVDEMTGLGLIRLQDDGRAA